MNRLFLVRGRLQESSILILTLAVILSACTSNTNQATSPVDTQTPSKIIQTIDRRAMIPSDAVKVFPETDPHPPQMYSDEFTEPIPVPGNVNTSGAEDSPFIMPDGKTLYLFFTPHGNIPVEEQLMDGVTGIYVSEMVAGRWEEPQRVFLQDAGKLALDGCGFVLDDRMWFCSAREGYDGMHWFTAEYEDGRWRDLKIADFNPDYKVGELHITSDGRELYYHSDRPGGKGGLDIWVSENVDGVWQEPLNVSSVNTEGSEGWPAISPDGSELWFSRDNGIWRSKMVDGKWQEAELIVSPLAGEPSVDAAGNLYFVHHFFENGEMIEADIYVAYRR